MFDTISTSINSKYRFLFLLVGIVVVSSSILSCTAAKLGWDKAAYEEIGWLPIIPNDTSSKSGYKRLQEEIHVRQNVKVFVAQKGTPDYLRVTGVYATEFAYLQEGMIYQFDGFIPELKNQIHFSEYDDLTPSLLEAFLNSAYENLGWLKVIQNNDMFLLGYQRLQEEILLGGSIKEFITEKGIPDYLRVTGLPSISLFYLKEGLIYEFEGDNLELKNQIKFSDYKEMLPSELVDGFQQTASNPFIENNGCSTRKTCSAISSCSEALYLFSTCTHIELDENKNGVPCEQNACKLNNDTARLYSLSPSLSSSSSKISSRPLPQLNMSKPVHVRGYYRKDGTYVRPHTRQAPGTRKK